jgi:sulfate permease, SulP family
MALLIASIALALCLLFLTGLLENLPKAVLAAVVLTAVAGLFDFRTLVHMWRVSRLDFCAAAIALVAVLLFGILQGILLAALASILLLLLRVSRPHIAFLGRNPGTNSYSDLARYPESEALPGVIIFCPEAALIYVNADSVRDSVLNRLHEANRSRINLVVCDLSASPYLDLAGARVLHELHSVLSARNIALRIVGARGSVRDLLQADGVADKIGGLDRLVTPESVLNNTDKCNVASSTTAER